MLFNHNAFLFLLLYCMLEKLNLTIKCWELNNDQTDLVFLKSLHLFDLADASASKTVEYCDLECRNCKEGPSMNHARAKFGSAVLNSKIFVLGNIFKDISDYNSLSELVNRLIFVVLIKKTQENSYFVYWFISEVELVWFAFKPPNLTIFCQCLLSRFAGDVAKNAAKS